jgi:hypothetical protein
MVSWSSAPLSDTIQFKRIDPEFFDVHYIKVEDKVLACHTERLGSLGDFVPGPFGSAFQVRNYDYKSEYRYIRGRDVKPFFLLSDDNRYVPESDYKRLEKYAVRIDDLLLSVVGTLGNVSICTEDDAPAVFSCKSTIFRSGSANPLFLLTYLNTEYGRNCLLRRQRGAIQAGLNIDDLKSIPVPRFDLGEEDSVSALVASAHTIAKSAEKSWLEAVSLFDACLGLDKVGKVHQSSGKSKFTVTSLSRAFDANRVDAQCFSPEAVYYESVLLNYGKCEPLDRLISSLAKGRQQAESDRGSTDYCSIKHISGREIVDAAKTTPAKGTPTARRNDLLLAITGATIGKIGIVKRYDDLVFSGDMLRLRPNARINVHFLLLALNHHLGQVQFNRWITGSTNGHLSPRDVGRVLVPRLAPEREDEIAGLVEQSIVARQESEMLLEQAKVRVEQLIEEAVAA